MQKTLIIEPCIDGGFWLRCQKDPNVCTWGYAKNVEGVITFKNELFTADTRFIYANPDNSEEVESFIKDIKEHFKQVHAMEKQKIHQNAPKEGGDGLIGLCALQFLENPSALEAWGDQVATGIKTRLGDIRRTLWNRGMTFPESLVLDEHERKTKKENNCSLGR